VSDLETLARAEGFGWDEINDVIQSGTTAAGAQGYSQDEIDSYLGFDPVGVSVRAERAVGAVPPTPHDPTGGMLDLSGYDWRGGYAAALMSGETRGSYDWADSVAAAALDRMEIADPTTREHSLGWAARAGDWIATQLPGRREFTDAALDVSGAHPDDPAFDDVRRNLIDHWHDTGEAPADAANRSRVNTDLDAKLQARPQRGVVGEIAAGVARGAGSLLFGLEHIANNVEATVANLFNSDELRATAKRDIGELARREADWMKAYQRGEGVEAFIEGTVGEAIPTVAEYVVAGVPRMVMYGALHGASAAWERTGSATAAYAGALIGGAEAGAPAPFLHGAAGQGFVKAAVKGAIGMGAIGGVEAVVDPLVDAAGGRGYTPPSLEQIGEAAAGGAIVGAMFGSFAGLKPKARLVDMSRPDAPDRVVGLDDPALKPTEPLHSFAADLARRADQLERLRLENEGLVPGNATESGGFFQRRLAEMQGIDDGEPPLPAFDPKQVQALAEGYRAAFSLRKVADDLFGPLWRDETGAMKLGGRVSLNDADLAAMRERADTVDQAVRYNEAIRDRYNTDVRKDLQPLYRMIEPHMGEWEAAHKSGDIEQIKNSKIGQFIAHMQGVDGYVLPADHELTPFATLARKLLDTSRAYAEDQIAKGNMNRRAWQQDYWMQQWTDPNAAERIFGSSAFQKVVPDYFTGIERGLKPLFLHPVEHLFHSLTRSAAMWNKAAVVGHLAGNYARDAEGNVLLDKNGLPQGRDPNAPVVFTREQPSGNMTPIRGMTRRGVYNEEYTDLDSGKSYERRVVADLQAYASPEIAKMVQAWHDRYSVPTATESVFGMINRASNTALALKLIVPVFHAIATSTEMVAGGIGTLARLTNGELTTRDIGEAVAKATALAKQLHTKGMKLSQTPPAEWNMDPLIDAALKGGFRHGKRQSVYMPGRAPDIIESLTRGTLGRELREEYERDGLKMVPYELGRAMTTLSAPLFDHAIPMMKTVSTLAQLELAMRQNPTMSAAERFKIARQISDNTDHRLGEMNMNNLFWPRWVRRTLSAALISPSWVYGTTAYTLAGLGYRIGPKGLRGLEWNPVATANLVGLAVATAGINGIAQWLWSGKLPGEASPIKSFPEAVAMDLLYPRTGGVSKGWAQARMMIPSQMKEYYDWAKVVQETYAGYKVQGGGPGYAFSKFVQAMSHYGEAKVRPLWNGVFALMGGEDAIGRDPALYPGGLGRFLAEQFMPIAATQWQDYRPKSGIGRVGASLGLRELPDWIEDPRRYWGIQQYLVTKRTREQLRQWRRHQSYLQ